MIKTLNILGQPSRDKLSLFVAVGISLFALAIIDVILSSFFEINITSILPRWLNFFTPILFGFVGLHYIRIEFSGNKTLDNLNKNINSNWLNSILTLIIIFVLIQNIPPLLNWLLIDADFVGTSKEECSREGACWIFIKVWIKRLIYGLYPNPEIWRINLSFLMLIGLVITAFFVPIKIKKYIILKNKLKKNEYIRSAGSDFKKKDKIVKKGQLINSTHILAFKTLGIEKILVKKKPTHFRKTLQRYARC